MDKKKYLFNNILIFTLSFLVILTSMVVLFMTGPIKTERLIVLTAGFMVFTIQSTILFLLVLNFKKRIW